MDRRKSMLLAGGVGAGLIAGRALLRGRRRFDLEERVVLVTGSSRGLGLQLAREFASRGAKLALCARDPDELESARRDLEKGGVDVFVHACDVTQRDQVAALVKAVCDHYGQIDVLVNNAGVIEVGPLEAMSLSDFEEAMRTHFYASLYATLEVMDSMRRRRDGRIVNISSIGGLLSVPHLLPYCSSKFALTGFSEGLRIELAKDDVYVTTVCPGLMRTGSPVHAFFKGHPLREFRWFVSGATLPLLTMNPTRAAKKIVDACVRGQAELILTPQAKLAVRAKVLFPELTQDVLQLVARALPDALGGSPERVEGVDLEPPRGGSLFDRLNRFAALRYNEYAR